MPLRENPFRLFVPAKGSFLTCLLVLAASGASIRPAHAGMFSLIDNMFTFREDQKPLVAPRRAQPPKEVVTPYYTNRDHADWSDYYTRDDLSAQTYIDGSATKVMRPPAPPQSDAVAYRGSDAPSVATPTGGWRTFEARAAQNAQDGDGIRIGDPDQLGDIEYDGGDGVGRQTKVAEPVGDWRAEQAPQFSPRPGDFDYVAPNKRPKLTDEPLDPAPVGGRSVLDVVNGKMATQGNSRNRANDGGALAARAREDGQVISQGAQGDDPRYVKFNAKGQVTKYRVQPGDNLSSIAGQDAVYNNSQLWPLIYSANRKAIGHDPANLKNQQTLGIPRGYSQKQAKEAERRAVQHGKR